MVESGNNNSNKKYNRIDLKYTPKFFSDSMPNWKRKKDPPLTRMIYRPFSFVLSSLFSSVGVSANAISYFNILIALAATIFFLMGTKPLAVIGAIFVNIWLLFDCVDGNIARSVKKQPYGEFADSVSGYLFVPLLCISVGIYTFEKGGLLCQPNSIWIVLIASLAGCSDTLMRLIYHKFKDVSQHMVDLGVIDDQTDERTDHSKVNSIRVRIESDWGLGGFLPIMTLLATIFNLTDLLVFYCLFYFSGAFIVTTGMYIYKAVKYGKLQFVDPEDADEINQGGASLK